jgi:EmrB/QacA subfamily drug resistance transporter
MTANLEQPDRSRWALAALSLCMLAPSLAVSIANVGLPTLAQAFAAPFQAVQWVVIAYLLAVTALIVGVGRLGDTVGRRRLLLGGIGLFTAASLLCGLAPTLGWLIAARAVQGLGAAVMMALAMALVGEAVPKARTGAAMGLMGTMSAVGTTLGPSLGGVLIEGFGWRAIFLVNAPLGLAGLWLAFAALPAHPPAARPAAARFDAAGAFLLALALAAYALAMTLGRGRFGALNLALLAAAAVAGGVFVFAQARSAAPLLRPAMFADPALNAALAANLLVSTVMMATLVVGPFYLSGALGLDAARTGLAMSAGPLVAALAGVPAGRMVDRFGARRLAPAGLAGMAAGLLALSAAPAGAAGYVAALAAVTASYALFQAANNTAVMAEVEADQRGGVSGLLNLSRNLGLITGAAAMGAVFALASGAADIAAAPPQAVAAGMRTTFAVAAALAVAALAAAAAGHGLSRRPAAAR